jgi:polar amino acid transport system substrate-binding protein
MNSVRLPRTTLAICGLLAALLVPSASRAAGKDLTCSIAIIPGLSDPPGKGAFVDLAKAMAEVYTEGKINIELHPWGRSIDNVVKGKADFHIPNMRVPGVDESKIPFRFAKKQFGELVQVIYSNDQKVVTKKALDDAAAKWKADGTHFPYVIEVTGGDQYPFPTVATNDYNASFKKLALGRIDAILGAQEDCDKPLREMRLKDIHRAEWNEFQDVLVVAKGPRGEEVDRIVSDLLAKLEKSGKLQKIYSQLHLPYSDWQPATSF